LQKDRRAPAADLVRSVTHDVANGPTKENRARAASSRAIWLVETRGAAGADATEIVDSSGITWIDYFAADDFARGLVAAAGGDVASARTALAQLSDRVGSARLATASANQFDALSEDDLAQARALATALDGAIKFAEGQHAAGIAQVRAAIEATAQLQFEYGPPWSAKPLDELLGEMLLTDGQKAEAAAAFQRVLLVYPNRRLAVEGLVAAGGTPPPVWGTH
jgi:hypothetical protein